MQNPAERAEHPFLWGWGEGAVRMTWPLLPALKGRVLGDNCMFWVPQFQATPISPMGPAPTCHKPGLGFFSVAIKRHQCQNIIRDKTLIKAPGAAMSYAIEHIGPFVL